MFNMVMRINPALFVHIPVRFKTQEMCNKALRMEPYFLVHGPEKNVW